MAGAAGDAPYLAKLRGLLEPRPQAQEEERCDLCGTPIPEEHGHLVNVETRSLLCACRPCALLFTRQGAGGGRYRTVPERYRFARDLALTEAQWESLQIPVNIAFFFHNSALGRAAAFYPGPAGAAESLLPLATWQEVVEANPLLAGLEPDVEALLVRRGHEAMECYVVPITACYELVGRLRLCWKGFEGGEEARREIAEFFTGLRLRSGQPAATPETSGEPAAAAGSAGG